MKQWLTEEDLIPIAGLLDKIRCEKRVKERKSGVLYRLERHFCTSMRIVAASLLIFAVLTIGTALPSTIGAGRLCRSPKCRDFSQTPARMSRKDATSLTQFEHELGGINYSGLR